MDLIKLKDLSSKLIEHHNMFRDLQSKVKEERNKIEKEIEALEKQLSEINEKKEKEEENYLKSFHRIYEDITPLLNEANKYGMYNINDLGLVLADLVTKITGKKHIFGIREENDFTCINNYGVYYTADEAYLQNIEPELYDTYYFEFAKSKAPTFDSEPYGTQRDGAAYYGSFTHFSKYDLVNRYNPYLNQYESAYLYRKEIDYPFVLDFLNYVSMYRLNNDIKIIRYKLLESLANKFLEENNLKYQEYYKTNKQLRSKQLTK